VNKPKRFINSHLILSNMGAHTIELSDLERGVQREFSITPIFLRFILSRYNAGDQQTLDECMRVAADFTAITYREMAIIIHSQLPKNPDEYKHRSRFSFVNKLAVPNVGDMGSVHNPTLDGVVYSSFVNSEKDVSGQTKNATVYVPIVHLHTHPGKIGHRETGTFPSKNDLMNTRARYQSEVDVAGVRLRIVNPELQVINMSTGLAFSGYLPISSQLFYQFTGNDQAYQDFLNGYDRLLSDCSSSPKKFAQQMQRSGAFKTEYFEPGELVGRFDVKRENGQGIKIKKKNETKLARKFAYTLKVYRQY